MSKYKRMSKIYYQPSCCDSSSTKVDMTKLIFADNDGQALSIGIALNDYYKASNTNTMGLPVGTVKQNVGLS